MLQGCFEVIEQVFIKTDGSGSFNLIINMSKSKTKLNAVMKMKTVNGHKVPDKAEINRSATEIREKVSRSAGISNVKTSLDFTNFIAGITCDFKKVDNLNTAIKNVSRDDKTAIANVYEHRGNIFSRMNKFGINEAYQKLSAADKEIFSTATYTGIFRFEKEVASASNKSAKVSGNKKAVMLKLNALDIISGKQSIENKITIK